MKDLFAIVGFITTIVFAVKGYKKYVRDALEDKLTDAFDKEDLDKGDGKDTDPKTE